jgi:1-acyl-sn-glycerol-3-phosphate acyltransferase
VPDPAGLAAVQGRSCLFLGNHQVAVESMLFSVLASALYGQPTVTLAKMEHKTTWVGKIIEHCFSFPGVRDPQLITFFDRSDKDSLPRIVKQLGMEMATVGRNVLVHVEGTRSLSCNRTPVEKMSSLFIDMALQVNAPIVPVRFFGGLPVEPLDKRIEYPLDHGKQSFWFGSPILPETLAALPYKERKALVMAGMNELGPAPADERPYPGNPDFGAAVKAWHDKTGADLEHSAILQTLARLEQPGEAVQKLLAGAESGTYGVGDDAEGQWLAELAGRLFGPNGPKVVVG